MKIFYAVFKNAHPESKKYVRLFAFDAQLAGAMMDETFGAGNYANIYAQKVFEEREQYRYKDGISQTIDQRDFYRNKRIEDEKNAELQKQYDAQRTRRRRKLF